MVQPLKRSRRFARTLDAKESTPVARARPAESAVIRNRKRDGACRHLVFSRDDLRVCDFGGAHVSRAARPDAGDVDVPSLHADTSAHVKSMQHAWWSGEWIRPLCGR